MPMTSSLYLENGRFFAQESSDYTGHMLALQLLLAMVLLVVCGFPAGFYLTRNLRWSPMEKLCGSIGASYGLLYLVFGTIYLLTPVGAEIPRKLLAFVSVASLGLAFALRRDFVRLFESFRVRQAGAGFFSCLSGRLWSWP